MRFIKAQGLGNDFAILIDPKASNDSLGALSQRVADRRYGVGCDQVIAVTEKETGFFVRFFNPDGSEAESCGNGSRCVAKYLMEKRGTNRIELRTPGGDLDCRLEADGAVTVAMPLPTVDVVLGGVNALGHLSTPDAVAVKVGNPHLVCFVDDVNLASRHGEGLENHPMFPRRTNVGFAKLLGDDLIELKVWERGAGITPACGSGACAAVVAAATHNLVKPKVKVTQAGGDLWISYDASRLSMTGEAEIVFTGDYRECDL